jgi:DNA gyrase subunit A
MRVVVELKRDVQAKDVLKQLYKQTALESNFGVIMLALVDGQPRQLTLRQLLEEFLSFREHTLTRQYTYELEQNERRLHIVEGLLACLTQLDAVIEILRNAPDGTTAKMSLQSQLNISENQADAILSMPLRRITGLEQQKLQTEFDELNARIEQLRRLLSDRNELLKTLKKDLRSLKRRYADPRRTKIAVKELKGKDTQPNTQQQLEVKSKTKTSKSQEAGNNKSKKNSNQPSPSIPDSSPDEEETVLEFTHQGYVQRLRPPSEQKSTRSAGRTASSSGATSLTKKGDDFVVQTQRVTTRAELVVITSGGKAYPVKVRDIPPAAGRKEGIPLVSLLPDTTQSETVVAHFMVPDALETLSLILLTQQGRIKRLPMSELTNLTMRGTTLIKLKDDDHLEYVSLAQAGEQLALSTSNGRILRFEINDAQLPLMGRSAQGNQALRLRQREQVVGCVTLSANDNLLLVSEQGYGKRLPVSAIRLVNRGDIGTQALQFKTATDILVGMVRASLASEVMLVTNAERKVPLPLDSVKFWGKDGTGDRIAKLKPEEKIISLTALATESS